MRTTHPKDTLVISPGVLCYPPSIPTNVVVLIFFATSFNNILKFLPQVLMPSISSPMAHEEEGHSLQLHESQEEEEEEEEEEERGHAWKCGNGKCGSARRAGGWLLGGVLDPRSKWIQEWNRAFLLVSATGLAVDPLFFYALSISDTCLCLFIDGWFAITVTVLRCMADALHIWNMWLQLKMACAAAECPQTAVQEKESLNVRGRGGAVHYLKSKTGFFLDLFVVLPLPQVLIIMSHYLFLSNFFFFLGVPFVQRIKS